MIQDIITRYQTLLSSNTFNPYYNNLNEWRKGVENKIKELKEICRKNHLT